MGNVLNKLSLSAIILVALTITVLVGIALTESYSKVLRTTTTFNASDTTVVASLAAPNSSNEVGSTGTYPFLQELTGCVNGTNASDALSVDFYSIGEGSADGGVITLNQDGLAWEGDAINCTTLEYLADSDAQDSADKFTLGLAIFGTFAGILVLAIVGKAIVGLFKKKEE